MDREEMIERYKDCLCFVCRQSAFLEDVRVRIENGEVVPVKEITSRLSLLERAKEELLSLKESLGFEGGLDFMDDVKFQGFQFKDGTLSGDYSNLYKLISPWVLNFDEKKPFTYEVGVLILFHYMRQTGQDDDGKVSLIGKLKKCWLRFIRKFSFRIRRGNTLKEDF